MRVEVELGRMTNGFVSRSLNAKVVALALVCSVPQFVTPARWCYKMVRDYDIL